uniref:Coiled-coil domain containing 112 n=1 Tax=Oryzias latipes TaxID=8090 RepID=A0A3P9LET6_ORYLA
MAVLATCGFDNEPLSEEEEEPSVQHGCASAACDRVDNSGRKQTIVLFLREAEKNRRLIEKLENESTLKCKKYGLTEVCGNLEEYEDRLEKERNAERASLQKQLMKIQKDVRKFQHHLIDVKPTPELIERLKDIMSDVETSINSLKEEQRSCFEKYLKEEMIVRLEISAYEKKIENWSLPVKSNPKLPSAPTTKIKLHNRDLPAEVRAPEDFLQKTGGPYGGWDQCDHQVFLRIWTKHRGQTSYRNEAKLHLPDKTAEEIKRHECWHLELLSLQEKKKKAIQLWKASKRQEHQIRKHSQEETEKAQRAEEEARILADRHRTTEERKEVARQLEKWREEKRRKEEQEEEQRVAKEIQRRKLKGENCRRQKEVKLDLVEQLKIRREMEAVEAKTRREEERRKMEERRREAAKVIKQFQERDLRKVEAKLHEKHLREKEEVERREQIAAKLKEKVNEHISRDPSRLIRPTKGWQERMKHIGPSGGGPLLQMFHRAVPTWRQGL